MPVDLAGWSLLLVRGEDCNVRGFHNVCRHRSNRVSDKSCRGLKHLTCPWHAWVYSLEGNLLRTPRIGGERTHTAPGFDTAEFGLKPVATGVWLDFVMVNIDGTAPAFEQHIHPLEELLDGYDFTDLSVGAVWDIEFEGNWKLTVEGAIEDYHIPCIHPEIVVGATTDEARLNYVERCYFSNSQCRDSQSAHGEVRSKAGVTMPPFLREGAEPRTFAINIFPTGIMGVRNDTALLQVISPQGARITHVDTRECYKGAAASAPETAVLRKGITQLWQRVFEQDLPYVKNVQLNMDTPGEFGVRPRFSPYWESNVPRFQQSIIRCLQDH